MRLGWLISGLLNDNVSNEQVIYLRVSRKGLELSVVIYFKVLSW